MFISANGRTLRRSAGFWSAGVMDWELSLLLFDFHFFGGRGGRGVGNQPHCGWTKSCTTLKPGLNHGLLVFTGEASFQVYLSGAKWISSIHSRESTGFSWVNEDHCVPHRQTALFLAGGFGTLRSPFQGTSWMVVQPKSAPWNRKEGGSIGKLERKKKGGSEVSSEERNSSSLWQIGGSKGPEERNPLC